MHAQKMTRELDGTTPAEVALRFGEWTLARDRFAAVLAEHPRAGAYEGLAQALWWLEDPGCLEAREAAYRLYRSTDADTVGAARAATALKHKNGWLPGLAERSQIAPYLAANKRLRQRMISALVRPSAVLRW